MCRSLKDGTRRRCPSCTSYPAAARANGNRRQGRLARRKVVDHLNGIGLTKTANAVLAAPPSMLAPFLAALDIDPAILGDVPLPGTGPRGSDAAALIQQATSERAQQHQRAQATAAAASTAAAPQRARRAAAVPVHAGAAARLARALANRRGAGAPRRPGAAPAAANVPNCRTNIGVISAWENRAEEVFAAGGNKTQCRVACAEAEMLCKGCPLMESCAQEAKASHYTGIAGGRIFVNGRHRLTPSSPTRIVA
ncbi:hypothetical protein H7I87_03130 [Mycobacterium timonense]|uniref:4Fe-4S Wbl-type domain-containing protein n=3 Tax=Mycobacterium TaxID=1763 RepID=A0AAW5SA63_MYCBC|nr:MULTISPECIES: hypothetical protein [Mycobacterium]MCV6992104.1 hypothetical protein [Mycobacterium bouchedurhonense]MCV6993724.1 hypothetical protein [Mycobacterium timonense]ORA45319.1 hypothetical protein BST19_20290 [Mycobacterium bouchedurhonense]ORB77496.1 hypothetical protein BST46_24185 [Mycobacterium timonense]CQD02022.1 hypothetical protein BN000_00075 [Mycobacterium europaeum]